MKDFFGEPLNVGDEVAFTDSTQTLTAGVVSRACKTFVEITLKGNSSTRVGRANVVKKPEYYT